MRHLIRRVHHVLKLIHLNMSRMLAALGIQRLGGTHM